MSYQATIIATGPFSKTLLPHIQSYPESYENTPEGTPILFPIAGTHFTNSSRELQNKLKVDLDNPQTWKINGIVSKIPANDHLDEIFEVAGYGTTQALITAHAAGLTLFFDPEH
jgi:hypothetical protein